jgi:hypothetical protein
MGAIEQGQCDFCKEIKSVQRTYLRPSKYKKPEDAIEACKLYNEGNYFLIIRTCSDCGTPK